MKHLIRANARSSCLPRALALSAIITFMPGAVRAQDGTLDGSFNPNADNAVYAIAEYAVAQPAGHKILVGGYLTTIGDPPAPHGCIARLNTDGTVDNTFTTQFPNDGSAVVSSLAVQVVQADPLVRKILVGGDFTSFSHTNIVRLFEATGDPDPSFATSTTGGGVKVIRVLPNNQILIGGEFTSVTSTNGTFLRKGIALLNANGTVDGAFNANLARAGIVNVLAIVVQPSDGQILVGGSFESVSEADRRGLVRLNPATGAYDPSFTANVVQYYEDLVRCLQILPNGNILLGGTFSYVSGPNAIGLYRYSLAEVGPTGVFTTFAPFTNEVYPTSLNMQANGKIVVCGTFSTFLGQSRKNIARLNEDLTLDLGFNPALSPNASIETSAIQANGKILIGGYLGTNGTPRDYLARINGTPIGAPAAPEIVVEQPMGTPLTDGASTAGFGAAAIGVAVTRDFKIINSGDADLTIQSATATGDFSTPVIASPITVTPGNFTALTVTFTPTNPANPGARTGTLQITNNDADEGPFDVNLTGTCIVPEIAVEQPALTGLTDGTSTISFGAAVLRTTVAKIFTIKNTGTADLTIQSATTTGDFITPVIASPITLTPGNTPGNSTILTVTFDPTTAGTRNGTLQIASNDPDENPFDIMLNGTGTVPEIAVQLQPAATDLTAGSASVDFGSNILGGGNIRTFTILNSGDGPMTGVIATLGGTNSADFVVSSAPTPTVSAGGSTMLTVRFISNTLGARDAILQIASTDADENPFDINLSGTATTSTVNATFNAAGDVPVSVDGLITAGLTLNLSLNFAPAPGTNLLVVNNTGTAPITGTFSGIAEGTKVTLTFGGQSYEFIATYLGGTGNDFILAWPGGGVVSWGGNFYGALGDGTTNTVSPYAKLNPTTVSGGGALSGKTVAAVAAGQYFSMALTTDGKVYCWGGNSRGQLGNGSTAASSVPVAVDMSVALAGKQVIAIAAGTEFGVALTSEGRVFAWGANELGQLGNGTFTDSSVPVPVPTSGVLAGKFVSAISAKLGHVLALTDNGRVYGWGYNAQGQLGTGTVTTTQTSPMEMNLSSVLPAGRTVKAISAGYYHSLVIDSGNRVLSCGDNSVGELGVSLATAGSATLVPINLTGPLAGEQIASVSAGGLHSLGITTTGKLFAWGDNLYGELGIGGGPATSLPMKVVTTGALLNKTVVATSVGHYFSLVLTADGQLFSWGKNNTGLLGDGSLMDRNTPAAVNMTGALAGKSATFIAAGYDHSLAIAVTPPVPEITVEQPVNTGLADGLATVDFTTVLPPGNAVRTFTIRNTGLANLTDIAVTKSGTNMDRFTISTPVATMLEPITSNNSSTTFTVTFAPLVSGAHTAKLHIASNDSDEGSFDIDLIGTGGVPVTTWRQQNFSTTANIGNAADDADPDKDGVTNLMEFALSADPNASSVPPTPLTPPNADYMEFSYTRNKQAMAELTYEVQWTDDLAIAWSSGGVVETVISDNGIVQQVTATLPAGPTGGRFVHLRVARP